MDQSLISNGRHAYSIGKVRRGLIMDPKWRIISLTLMALTFILLIVSTMSTNWREDKEEVINVFTNIGFWRICRDIVHGATVDHSCLTSLANDAPSWFQVSRSFLIIACFLIFVAFAYGVYTIANIPILKNRNARPPNVNLALPALLMFFAAIFSLIAISILAVATQMKQGLYFPEDKEPTWGNSWSQVMAKLNSVPASAPEVKDMSMTYGYSFALGWVGVLFCSGSFFVNLIASGKN